MSADDGIAPRCCRFRRMGDGLVRRERRARGVVTPRVVRNRAEIDLPPMLSREANQAGMGGVP